MTHARNTIFFANVQNEDNLFVFFKWEDAGWWHSLDQISYFYRQKMQENKAPSFKGKE